MIVVIDNERNVQATLSAVLQRNGFAVEIAPNAAQGRRKVAEVNPDLVLPDLGLPDADGLDIGTLNQDGCVPCRLPRVARTLGGRRPATSIHPAARGCEPRLLCRRAPPATATL